MIAAHFGLRDEGRPADRWLRESVRWTWKVKVGTHLELELMLRLKEAAETAAIDVFAEDRLGFVEAAAHTGVLTAAARKDEDQRSAGFRN